MTARALTPHIAAAQEALRSFFQSLLGEEAPLTVAPPEQTSAPPIPDGATILGGSPSSGPVFAVVLGPGWAGRLAEAMIGAPIPDEEAADLLGEAAGQAYGALRNSLAADGPTLPDASFAAATEADLDGFDLRIPFALPLGGGQLEGSVLLAATAEAPSAPPPPSVERTVTVAPAAFDDLGSESFGDGSTDLNMLSDVELEVTVELGRRRLPLADVLRLTTGSVVELDKMVGQPLSVYANGRLIAEGEAVVIDDQFGIRVTSLASRAPSRTTLV